MKKITLSTRRGGFTLVETLLAIGLVGVLLSLFLVVFVPARGMIRQALARQEAERITTVLRTELNTLRGNQQASQTAQISTPTSLITPFDKAFYWMQKCDKPGTAIVIFSYRADTREGLRPDGTYPALPANQNQPNGHSQLVTIACPMDDPVHSKEIKDAVGNVFVVRMTELEQQPNGSFKVASKPGTIKGAQSPERFIIEENNNLRGAIVYYRADFYIMAPPNPARYKNKPWKRLGRPAFSANLTFRR